MAGIWCIPWSLQTHAGIFHNENGEFIPWSTLCNAEQSYLLEPCDSLINPDGSA
jgi:hypothetical protein